LLNWIITTRNIVLIIILLNIILLIIVYVNIFLILYKIIKNIYNLY